jgi:2-succinyl-5-enolpyruvyl-6-hydroxy-3-cyclohexene-1-carboxylate synthase
MFIEYFKDKHMKFAKSMKSFEGLELLIKNLPTNTVVVSPGSRNAPVIFYLYHLHFQIYSAIDERAAGFLALGIAKASHQPVIINCTSGSAVVNYYPAVTEAYYSRIPLIILTADRPKSDINNWDGQAIMQENIFHPHIRGYFELENPEDAASGELLSQKLLHCINETIPGPIQINIPFAEPFYSKLSLKKSLSKEYRQIVPFNSFKESTISLKKLLQKYQLKEEKILIVHGDSSGESINLIFDSDIKPVILSDVTSKCLSNIQHWENIDFSILDDSFLPDVLISTGTTIVNRNLRNYLKSRPIENHLHISHFSEIGNPYNNTVQLVKPSADIISLNLKFENHKPQSDYLTKWKNIANNNSANDSDQEFVLFRNVLENIPKESSIFVGNSMPIRHAGKCEDIVTKNRLKIHSNRGVSGIDGCISTAIGIAKSSQKPMYVFTGDVAFLYETNSLLNLNTNDPVTIIVINNKGGRIFEKIKGSDALQEAIKYMTTGHSYSFDKIAEFYNLNYSLIEITDDLSNLFNNKSGNRIIELKLNNT